MIDEKIKLDCILDSLGDDKIMANVIKGPKIKKKFVDYTFLNNYLLSISHAKN